MDSVKRLWKDYLTYVTLDIYAADKGTLARDVERFILLHIST